MDAFPTSYFGSVLYYKTLAAAQHPIIETKEHFIKQTGRSRCEILGPNGKHTLSVTTKKGKGSKTSIEEVEIISDEWRKIHWKSIETAYSSSAYFDYYGIEVKELIFNSEPNLLNFNKMIHERICSWLDLPISVNYSHNYIDANDLTSDFRSFDFSESSKFEGKKYTQVFAEKNEYVENLSILDLIFNQGPMARNWIITRN